MIRSRRLWLIAVWLSVAGTVIGFFLPWVHITVTAKELRQSVSRATAGTPLEGLSGLVGDRVSRVVVSVKRGAKTVTGELPDLAKLPSRISGFDVPRLANRADAKVALVVAELLTGEQELGAKSFLVYLVPGLAVLIGLLLSVGVGPKPHLVARAAGGLCLLLGAAGMWKLATTHTDTLVLVARIGVGLWLSVWSYLLVGVSGLALGLAPRGAD